MGGEEVEASWEVIHTLLSRQVFLANGSSEKASAAGLSVTHRSGESSLNCNNCSANDHVLDI